MIWGGCGVGWGVGGWGVEVAGTCQKLRIKSFLILLNKKFDILESPPLPLHKNNRNTLNKNPAQTFEFRDPLRFSVFTKPLQSIQSLKLCGRQTAGNWKKTGGGTLRRLLPNSRGWNAMSWKCIHINRRHFYIGFYGHSRTCWTALFHFNFPQSFEVVVQKPPHLSQPLYIIHEVKFNRRHHFTIGLTCLGFGARTTEVKWSSHIQLMTTQVTPSKDGSFTLFMSLLCLATRLRSVSCRSEPTNRRLCWITRTFIWWDL